MQDNIVKLNCGALYRSIYYLIFLQRISLALQIKKKMTNEESLENALR